jgi:hypothetical protein
VLVVEVALALALSVTTVVGSSKQLWQDPCTLVDSSSRSKKSKDGVGSISCIRYKDPVALKQRYSGRETEADRGMA